MEISTEVKKQHTVPRFLLANFGIGKSASKKRLFTFDKSSESCFQQSVKDATTRKRFYNIENHPEKASLEPFLAIYENKAAPILKKLIKKKNLSILNDDDRYKLAIFIAFQRARSYGELMRFNQIISAMYGKKFAMGATLQEIEKNLGSPESSEIKNAFLKTILLQEPAIDNLLHKDWILYESDKNDPFYISDNPVSLHNNEDFGSYGNLGLSCRGIQIHLPISPTLTLALTCPSISEKIISAKEKVIHLQKYNPQLLKSIKKPFELIEYAKSYESGIPLKQSSSHVRFLNSLQVEFSEQFVFCQSDSFDLAREMINDNSKYKSGIRFTI